MYFYLNATATAVYRLHAAGSGYPGGLDSNKKGIFFSFLRKETRFGICIIFVLLTFGACASSQAMASLGPHRVKVDGKSFSLVSVNFRAELGHRLACRTGKSRFSSLDVNVAKLQTRTGGTFCPWLDLDLQRFPRQTFFPLAASCRRSRRQAGPAPPRGAFRGREALLRQPVVLQGAGHLHQQEGRLPHQVCVTATLVSFWFYSVNQRCNIFIDLFSVL